MRRLFWLIAAVFTALATHAAFVLAVPAFTLKPAIARIGSIAGANRFLILSQEDQARLFPTYPRFSVSGACAFDLRGGPVGLTASMPGGFWTLTIYSSSGDVIYAVNNTQAGTDSFTVNLGMAPGLLEMLSMQSNDESDAATGWNVKTSDPKGLAVLWKPLAEPALRPDVERRIAQSVCKPAGKG